MIVSDYYGVEQLAIKHFVAEDNKDAAEWHLTVCTVRIPTGKLL